MQVNSGIAPSMFVALTAILARCPLGLAAPFSVEPWIGEGQSDAIEIHFGWVAEDVRDTFYERNASVFQVVGGGEALIGTIVHVSDNDGQNVLTYWAV